MITVALIAALLLTGVIVAAMVLLRVAIGREEAPGSLNGPPVTHTDAAVRRMLGWHGSKTS